MKKIKKILKKKKYIERNELGEIIYHLSDFYQIFIDNLNGENLSLIDIMNYKDEELFRKCIKVEDEFMKNIYDAFSYFTYNFTTKIVGIDKDNYPLQVINYLKEHKNLRDSIINCVLSQKSKDKDIFSSILKSNYFTRDDVGLISVIQRYISELFMDNLTQFVFKSEKDHFLSSFIYNKLYEDLNVQNVENNKQEEGKKGKNYYMGNEVMKKLIEVYLKTLDISITAKFKKKIKMNKITILLGLKLPGMKLTLGSLRTYIKNELKTLFFEAEKDVKDLTAEDNENFMKEVQDSKNKIKSYLKNLETEINKNELFLQLIECGKDYQENNRQFYEWLTNDYYLLYLSDTLPDIKNSFKELEDYKNLLKIMSNLRFDSEDGAEELDPIKSLAMKMVWLESNNEYISILLSIYQKIALYKKNLFKTIDSILEKKEIVYEISDRSPEHAKNINFPFFFIMESLLKIITTDFDFALLKGQEFYDFINILKGICQDALRIVNELGIMSKEVFTIQEFLKIEQNLNNVNQSNLENIVVVLNILSDHSKFSNILSKDETKYKDLCDNIQKLYNFLKEKIGETDSFTDLILDVFLDEVKKIGNDNYRKQLVDIILGNPKLIAKSYPLMLFILKVLFYDSPEYICNTIDDIKNNNKPYLESISNTNNDCLNEIIISIFENQFNSYFDSIPKLNEEELEKFFGQYSESKKKNPTCLLLDKNLELFKICLNFLEGIYNNKKDKKNEKINNELICQLYCIAFVKIYLFKTIYFNHYKNQEFTGFNEVYKAIEGNAKNNFRRIIKIYVFKIFFYLLNNNYQDFKNYHYPNHDIKFFEEFRDKFEEKIEAMLNYYLLPRGEEYIKYKEEVDKFESDRFGDFSNGTKQFKDYIEKHGIDIFYTISSNIIISNLALPNYVTDSNEYSKYSSFAKNLFNNQLKLPEISKKLFLLFSNDETFNKIMTPKLLKDEGLVKIDLASFEILLYSLRLCIQTANTNNPNGFFYSELLTQNVEKIINENVIPGNNISDDIHITGYYNVVKHLNKYGSNVGAYVCPCGLYYDIGPCGFTNETSKCANCGQNIGNEPHAGGHTLAKRKGHYRIFKDQAQKNGEMSKYGDTDERTPNMLLADYKAKVIDPIIEKNKFGISKIKQNIFENVNQKVRKLSIVGYRLLNFVLYSHLFYSNCLGFIKNENMNKYICDGMTCLKMLVIDWKLLKDALQSKGIQIIQIFMNMIFPKLVEN